VGEQVHSEPQVDGSFWTGNLPEGWRFWRDKSQDHFPYVFDAPSGSKMQIWTWKNVGLGGFDLARAPKDLTTEEHRKAYLMTLNRAQMDYRCRSRFEYVAAMFIRQYWPRHKIVRYSAGLLTGFTYDRQNTPDPERSGHFSADPWMLDVVFAAPKEVFENDWKVALSILATVCFEIAANP
jgi:hypothetical protein